MVIDEQILKRVRDLGALGHTPSQIASLLDIAAADRNNFIDELSRADTPLYISYHKGQSIMDYNTNVELAHQAEKGDIEAITLFDERKQKQNVSELLSELFGI